MLTPTAPPPPPLSPFTIPNSPFTLLLGDPGTGKSLLSLDLAARLSRGQPLPFPLLTTDHSPLPASSIICSHEDHPRAIRARLHAAHANLAHIALAPQLSLQPQSSHLLAQEPSLIRFLNIQLRLLPNPRLLILDPLPSFLGLIDAANHPALIAQTLAPLFALAHAHQLAILGIHHLLKSPRSPNPLDLSIGSHAYPALAHTVLLLTHDSPPRRRLTPLKNPRFPHLAFTIAPGPQIHWQPAPADPPPPFPPAHSPPESFPPTQTQSAVQFLKKNLKNVPLPSKYLAQLAKKSQISPRTLERARAQLGAISFYNGTRWYTALPTHPHPFKPRRHTPSSH